MRTRQVLALTATALALSMGPGYAVAQSYPTGPVRIMVPFPAGGGVDEDPVTGSAHCLLTPFWASRLDRVKLSAVQASARGGRLGCRLDGDRVILTGACRTVIEGQFLL